MPTSRSRSSTDSGLFTPLHPVEYEVMRKLRDHPTVKISSLVVRRIPAGVCLQGVLESNHDSDDLRNVLREIEGVTEIVNHLVPCQALAPTKG